MGSPAVVTDAARPELGQFLRATCNYSEGDLVLSELPLLRVPRLRRLTAEALQKAPTLRQAKLFVPPESTSPALQRLRATTREADPEALFVKSVLHFNSFGAGPAGQDQVVFPTLARANHSCLPNCLVDADLGTLRAVRAVSVGEELTVSYLDDAGLLMDTASRQAELAERYEFRCECCRCSSAQDDTRRFSGCFEGDPSDLVFGSDLWRQSPSTVQRRLLEEEAKAKASLLAARSGDLEEEDEGHELMKCHRFTSAHRRHGLAFALANEFAFPDPEDAKQIVLEVIDLVLAMPCQLTVEACRDLALSLEGRRPDEARLRWAQAAAVAKILDGRESIEEVLQEWGRSTAPPPSVVKTGPNTDIEAFGQAQEDGTWLQRQRKAAGTQLQRRPKETGEVRNGSEESMEEASQKSSSLGGPRQDLWN